MRMKLQGILFDMDGTLIDSEKYYVEGTYEWIQRYGFNGEIEEVYSIIGTTIDVTYEILAKLTNLSISEVAKANDAYFNNENPLNYAKIIYPEVKKSLKEFKDMGLKLALCTSSSRKEIERFINECGLEGIFDVTLGFEDIVLAKPNPEIYLKALDKLDLDVDEAIIVEDSKEGIRAGINSNVYTFVRKDYHFNIDQSAGNAFIDNLNDLIEWVRSNING